MGGACVRSVGEGSMRVFVGAIEELGGEQSHDSGSLVRDGAQLMAEVFRLIKVRFFFYRQLFRRSFRVRVVGDGGQFCFVYFYDCKGYWGYHRGN